MVHLVGLKILYSTQNAGLQTVMDEYVDYHGPFLIGRRFPVIVIYKSWKEKYASC